MIMDLSQVIIAYEPLTELLKLKVAHAVILAILFGIKTCYSFESVIEITAVNKNKSSFH